MFVKNTFHPKSVKHTLLRIILGLKKIFIIIVIIIIIIIILLILFPFSALCLSLPFSSLPPLLVSRYRPKRPITRPVLSTGQHKHKNHTSSNTASGIRT